MVNPFHEAGMIQNNDKNHHLKLQWSPGTSVSTRYLHCKVELILFQSFEPLIRWLFSTNRTDVTLQLRSTISTPFLLGSFLLYFSSDSCSLVGNISRIGSNTIAKQPSTIVNSVIACWDGTQDRMMNYNHTLSHTLSTKTHFWHQTIKRHKKLNLGLYFFI
jgi:hypothetical protein